MIVSFKSRHVFIYKLKCRLSLAKLISDIILIVSLYSISINYIDEYMAHHSLMEFEKKLTQYSIHSSAKRGVIFRVHYMF